MFPTACRHHQDTLTSAPVVPPPSLPKHNGIRRFVHQIRCRQYRMRCCISQGQCLLRTVMIPPSTVPPTVPAPSPNGCPPTSTHWMPALGLRPDLPDNGFMRLTDLLRKAKEHGLRITIDYRNGGLHKLLI